MNKKSTSTSKVRVLGIDGNWYMHRAFHTVKTNGDFGTALAYRFLSMVCSDAVKVKATHMLVAFDGDSIFRYKLYKKYKASRNKDKKESPEGEMTTSREIYNYLPQLQELLTHAGICWTHPRKYEADDVMASLSSQFDIEDYLVILAFKDKDGYQTLHKRCRMWIADYKVDKKSAPYYLTAKMAKERKGVPIKLMNEYQTLIGDGIDDIPRIVSEKIAREALTKYGSIAKWYINADKKIRRRLRENKVQLSINRKLVTLVTTCNLPELEEMKTPKSKLEKMPSSYYSYIDHLYPKSKGLFRSNR